MKVVTRIPPSPTGRLHIGTARTALFNYLYAKNQGGEIVFRSEDTDRARSKPEYEQEIIAGLHWLGLSWDHFSRQSEHTERYKELLHTVIETGHAYLSKEPAKDDPSREVEVVRLKNPGKEVIFEDVIRGPVNTHTGELGDFVIARSLDDALYHFAVVVDDMDAGITHVIRGEDHISNTARQILIQEALGASRPIYAHLPLILDEKRAKLSKRSGATSVVDYQEEGFLPEALVNYVALLGWNPGTPEEDFSLEQLVKAFSLDGIQKSGAAWDRTKLLSVNQRWMRKLSDTEYAAQLGTPADAKVIAILKERARTFGEARELLASELAFLSEVPPLDKSLLVSKETTPGKTKTYLEGLIHILERLDGSEKTADEVRVVTMPYAEKEGRGPVLWPLRYALSGAEKSPDPFTIIAILGKQEAISRLQKALGILE